MRTKAILLALAATLSLGATSASGQATPGWRQPDPENVLLIDTNKGRIIAELTPFTAPQNVARIKELTRQKFYDGRAFFRVVDGFMAQTGDPADNGSGSSPLPNVPGEFSFKRGADARMVRVPATNQRAGLIGVMAVATQPDALMAMTVDGRVSAEARFCKGVLGMARANTPDSGNSQFFIMRETRPDLDGKYAPLGRVLIGLDVARALKVGEPVNPPQDRLTTVRLLADIPVSERPRVLVRDIASPEFRSVIDQQAAKAPSFDACDLDIEAVVQ